MGDKIINKSMIREGGFWQRFRKIFAGTLAISLILAVSFLGRVFDNAHAANTLASTGSEVISVVTTDSLPPDATIIVEDYSADGNVILFRSNASNLQGASGTGGLYTYNIKTNTTTRIDVSTSGVPANKGLVIASGNLHRISEDGRYVIFASKATNLMDGSPLPSTPNYISSNVRDIQTSTTTRLTSQSDYGDSDKYDKYLGISNDGRFILLASRYTANGYPYDFGIAYGDGNTGSFSWTSLGASGADDMQVGGMSCDGSFAVYQKYRQVYLKDLRGGGTTAISLSGDFSTSPLISCNGTYILYATKNRTVIPTTPAGMNTNLHLVRYNRITGERQYIDSNSSGTFSNGFWYGSPYNPNPNAFSASVTDTGDVIFNYNGGMYLKHLSDGSGSLESIGMTTSGTYVNITDYYYNHITNDGRYIFFRADPYDLGLAPSPAGNQIIRVKTNL